MIEKAEAGDLRDIADLMFPALVHANRRGDEGLKAIVEEMLFETGPEAFIRQQTAIMGRPDSRPTLSAIRCPTLVLVGDGDELTPLALAAEIAQGIAGAHLVTVPDCGHLSTWNGRNSFRGNSSDGSSKTKRFLAWSLTVDCHRREAMYEKIAEPF